MSVKQIKKPVTKLDTYIEHKFSTKVSAGIMAEIKAEFHAKLEPGQQLVGRYSVKTETHERSRLMSINDATVALTTAGYSTQDVNKILDAITVSSSARQFLVKRR